MSNRSLRCVAGLILGFAMMMTGPAGADGLKDEMAPTGKLRVAIGISPAGGAFWEGGANTFINKGVNGRWRDVLSPADSLAYERMAAERLGADCARWLLAGGEV